MVCFNRRKADALIIFETEDKNRPTRGINFGAWFLFLISISTEARAHKKGERADEHQIYMV
jgi:hypothetical protein